MVRKSFATEPVATKLWSFRWEYYCMPCREYEWLRYQSSRLHD